MWCLGFQKNKVKIQPSNEVPSGGDGGGLAFGGGGELTQKQTKMYANRIFIE